MIRIQSQILPTFYSRFLGRCNIFSTLELRSRYWQVAVDLRDRSKTAFVTSSGVFEFNRMSFGLKTAPATFQRAMEMCLCYLDDVICFDRSLAEHNDRLRTVLDRFRQHNLRVKLDKCRFAETKVAFLGHTVSNEGISPDPYKVEVIQNIIAPACLKELRSLFRASHLLPPFYCEFATIAALMLTKLTTKAASKTPLSGETSAKILFLN